MTSPDRRLSSLEGVTIRDVDSSERPYPCGEPHFPIVVEAQQFSDVPALRDFMVRHSPALKATLYEYGAILFRGFDVRRDEDFEAIITAFDGAQPMAGYFMSEKGRERIAGTQAVFNTNSLFKTGGGWYLGSFHSENFFSPDVPAVQSFWCKEPPDMGGETAIVQSAHVYADLPDALKAKLESKRVLARVIPLSSIAERYGLPEATVADFCRDVGLQVDGEGPDDRAALLFKPVLFKHPYTGRLALQVHVSIQIRGLDAALRRLIAPRYEGRQWFLSRLAWRSPAIASLLPALESWTLFKVTVSTLAREVTRLLRGRVLSITHAKRGTVRSAGGSGIPAHDRLDDRLTEDDVETLARAIWAHTSVFTWAEGDILIFDNLQVLHTGMPGRGRRELRVMLCDPIAMQQPVTSGILESASTAAVGETYGDRIEQLAARVS